MEYEIVPLKKGDEAMATGMSCCNYGPYPGTGIPTATVLVIDDGPFGNDGMPYNFVYKTEDKNYSDSWWGCERCVLPLTPHNILTYKNKLMLNLLTGKI